LPLLRDVTVFKVAYGKAVHADLRRYPDAVTKFCDRAASGMQPSRGARSLGQSAEPPSAVSNSSRKRHVHSVTTRTDHGKTVRTLRRFGALPLLALPHLNAARRAS